MSAGNAFARACRHGGIVPVVTEELCPSVCYYLGPVGAPCQLTLCWCVASGHAHVIARSVAFQSLPEGQAADAPWHVSNAGCLEAFRNAQRPTVPDT